MGTKRKRMDRGENEEGVGREEKQEGGDRQTGGGEGEKEGMGKR